METARCYCWGVVVEHKLHDPKVVGDSVIMNSCVPCVCIQAEGLA